MSKELGNCKGEIAAVIGNSTQAFEQRDEAQTKMQALQERTENDWQQHNAEMKDLQRMISHDNKIKDFMKVKASDRAELKAEEAAKKQAAGTNKGRDSDQAAITTYEEDFQRIRMVTGKHDLVEIVNSFVKSEEENFALFNYVTELNSQAEEKQRLSQQTLETLEVYEEKSVALKLMLETAETQMMVGDMHKIPTSDLAGNLEKSKVGAGASVSEKK